MESRYLLPAMFRFAVLLLFAAVFIAASTPAFSSTSAVPVSAPPWNASEQGQIVMSMTSDSHGDIWVGTEGNGVWRYSPGSPANSQWTQFTAENTFGSLGDDDCYALACDGFGRVWAGTNAHGVAVFNGAQWQTYDALSGPLGMHVTAIAVDATGNDVWIASDHGLSLYNCGTKLWSYYSRANGLPSEQITCLAVCKNGNVLVGTGCSGIAIGSAESRFTDWRTVSGPSSPPNLSHGDRLPSDEINSLLVTRDGSIVAGTINGFAHSTDGGLTWKFLRGSDWQDKIKGLYFPETTQTVTDTHLLLSEDYVNCLAEDSSGNVWMGHRSNGVEVLVKGTAGDLAPAASDPSLRAYVECLLPLSDGSMLIGECGGGLACETASSGALIPIANAATADVRSVAGEVGGESPGSVPSFPAAATAPNSSDLDSMRSSLAAVEQSSRTVPVVYAGEDWTTKGDWVGRYGRQDAVLWADEAPWDTVLDTGNFVPGVLSPPTYYSVEAELGPHHDPGDEIRHYLAWKNSTNVNALYSPKLGYRRDAELDDHGEAYPRTFEGPDLWVTVTVPDGVHRVSFYFFNKDGDSGLNRYRDYLIEWKRYVARASDDPVQRDGLSPPRPTGPLADLAAAMAEPDLAEARVRNFRNGVYEEFYVQGPATYLVRINKNFSLNTCLPGTFVDAVTGSHLANNELPMFCMGRVRLGPPQPSVIAYVCPGKPDGPIQDDTTLTPDPTLSAKVGEYPQPLQSAYQLIQSEANAYGSGCLAGLQYDSRLLVLRSLSGPYIPLRNAGTTIAEFNVSSLENNCRWTLSLWNDELNQDYSVNVSEGLAEFDSENGFSPTIRR